MTWTHILPYGPDAYAYWIAGIYKVVTYNDEEFHAYFIPDHYKNWGDHVSTPPNPTRYTTRRPMLAQLGVCASGMRGACCPLHTKAGNGETCGVN